MTENVHVKPSETARVRIPERGGAVLQESGEWVPRNVYWDTAIRLGDVIVSDPQPEVEKPKEDPAPSDAPRLAAPDARSPAPSRNSR